MIRRVATSAAQALIVGLVAAIVIPVSLQLLPRSVKQSLRGKPTIDRAIFVEGDTVWDVRSSTYRIMKVTAWDSFVTTLGDEPAAHALEGLDEIDRNAPRKRFWESGDMKTRPRIRVRLDGSTHASGSMLELGWPARCAWDASIITPSRHAPGPHTTVNHRRLVIPLWASNTVVLRYGVIWSGMAINIAFWGAALYIPYLLATFTWRHYRRFAAKRKGLCPNCRYDLEGKLHKGCPECGWRKSQI